MSVLFIIAIINNTEILVVLIVFYSFILQVTQCNDWHKKIVCCFILYSGAGNEAVISRVGEGGTRTEGQRIGNPAGTADLVFSWSGQRKINSRESKFCNSPNLWSDGSYLFHLEALPCWRLMCRYVLTHFLITLWSSSGVGCGEGSRIVGEQTF